MKLSIEDRRFLAMVCESWLKKRLVTLPMMTGLDIGSMLAELGIIWWVAGDEWHLLISEEIPHASGTA